MASLTRRIRVYTDGNLLVDNPTLPPPEPTPIRTFWRIPHDTERVNVNRKVADNTYISDQLSKGFVRQAVIDRDKALPEVFRLDPEYHCVLDCKFQKLWRDLNPELSDKRWSSLLGNAFALTNDSGFPGHFNCITGEDNNKSFPRFDQMRVMGGAILAGTERNGIVYFESILTINPAPSASQVLAKPWLWYWATSINPQGKINKIPRLALDGTYKPVRIPVITSQQVTLPASQLHRLESGFWPEPTWTHYL